MKDSRIFTILNKRTEEDSNLELSALEDISDTSSQSIYPFMFDFRDSPLWSGPPLSGSYTLNLDEPIDSKKEAVCSSISMSFNKYFFKDRFCPKEIVLFYNNPRDEFRPKFQITSDWGEWQKYEKSLLDDFCVEGREFLLKMKGLSPGVKDQFSYLIERIIEYKDDDLIFGQIS